MKRRNFIRSLAAMLSAPALPATAMIQASATSAPASALLTPNLYTWSKTLARKTGKLSADTIASSLNIEMTKASEIFGRLVSNGVIGPTNALGVSQARPLTQINIPSKMTEALTKPIDSDERACANDASLDEQTEQSHDENLNDGGDDLP